MSDTTGQVLSVSSKQGTKREYETILILRPNTNKDGIREFVTKMQGVFEKCGARLIKIENWGNRLLAYPIKRSANGIYLYWRYLGKAPDVWLANHFRRLVDGAITREALAEALSDFGGAIVLVSHDRHLTGLVCNTYWRVADGHVEEFDGDLDEYAAWVRTRGNRANAERRNAAAA